MGYHVILRHNQDEIKTVYIERKDQLAELPIQADSIIYEGEEHWKPVLIGQDEKYKDYLVNKFRAGKCAEKLFVTMCRDAGMIIEKISQDQDTFGQYSQNAEGIIKRGDFLIRKPRLCEVEVKCFTLREKNSARPYYYLPYSQVMSHARMENVVNNDVLLAIYEREDDKTVQESLRMIEIKKLLKQEDGIIYEEKNTWKSLRIPVDLMKPGLVLLQETPVEKV
jgi:hypothetical protein